MIAFFRSGRVSVGVLLCFTIATVFRVDTPGIINSGFMRLLRTACRDCPMFSRRFQRSSLSLRVDLFCEMGAVLRTR